MKTEKLSPSLVNHAIQVVLDMRFSRAIKVQRKQLCKLCGCKQYMRKDGRPHSCTNPECRGYAGKKIFHMRAA